MRRWKVSSSGGSEPRWNSNGRELFFISADEKLMSAKVRPGSEFDFDPPTELFALSPLSAQILQPTFRYDVAPGGQRFLILRNGPLSVQPPVTVVTNWRKLLKK
jgi:hypothetical protein